MHSCIGCFCLPINVTNRIISILFRVFPAKRLFGFDRRCQSQSSGVVPATGVAVFREGSTLFLDERPSLSHIRREYDYEITARSCVYPIRCSFPWMWRVFGKRGIVSADNAVDKRRWNVANHREVECVCNHIGRKWCNQPDGQHAFRATHNQRQSLCYVSTNDRNGFGHRAQHPAQ